MATVYLTGNQRPKSRSYSVTVSAAAVGGTLTATINGKAETYTCVSTVAADEAAAFVNALSTSLVAELRNFTFSASGAVVTATGPVDGRPVAISWSAAGGSTVSSSTVAPTSPNDASDGANYSTGSLPTGSDTLVFENTGVSLRYNLAALTSTAVAVVKRASYGGQVGLPDTNENGYPEYLPTHLESKGTSYTIEDNGVPFRVKATAAGASTVTVTGGGGGRVGQESVEVTGIASTSTVNVIGGTLALAPLTSQSAAAATVRVANGAYRSGPGAVVTAVVVNDSQAEIAGNYTTLVIDKQSTVTVRRAATAATSTTVNGGTLDWRSTGSPGNLTIGSGATADFSNAPGTITVGTVTLYEGCTLNDPYEMIARPFDVVYVGDIGEMTLNMGTSGGLTFT